MNLLPASTAPWWQLASDGSYVCIGSSAGLTIYSTATGLPVASRAGDYSLAQSFSAPGSIQVALGPAGANVIETVSAADGTSTTSAAFTGQFNSWFVDGARFLANLTDTVYVYSNAAVEQATVTLPTVANLTGQGDWIWTYNTAIAGYPLDVYAIGSATPALSFNAGIDATVVPSGTTIGVLAYGAGQASVIDLSGVTPVKTDYTDPIAYLGAYAASSSSQWVVGNAHGALLDGASLASTPRYFGHGAAWSIAGSSGNVAISTAIGEVLVYDPSVPTLDETINFSSGKLALSSDGSVLGASANANDSQYELDRTLNFYSLPSGTVISSFPYTFQNLPPTLFDFSLSGSGTTIGQVTGSFQGGAWTLVRNVTAIGGGASIWTDSQNPGGAPLVDPILLSPDGTLIGASTPAGGPTASSATSIIQNGTFVASVAGVAAGWIDNDRLLVNLYITGPGPSFDVGYSSCTIYSAAGVAVATPLLPELTSIQTVTSDSVYGPALNSIYSLTTGLPTWTATYPSAGIGAVAGSYVVYESGHRVVLESH